MQLEQENKGFERALVVARHENSLAVAKSEESDTLTELREHIRKLESQLDQQRLKKPVESVITGEDNEVKLLQEQVAVCQRRIQRLEQSGRDKDDLISMLKEELRQTKKLFLNLDK